MIIKYWWKPSYIPTGTGECIPDCNNNPTIKETHTYTRSFKSNLLLEQDFIYYIGWRVDSSNKNRLLVIVNHEWHSLTVYQGSEYRIPNTEPTVLKGVDKQAKKGR